MKKWKALGALALTLSLVGCGYQGGYRYTCQDPANWEKEECNPPICTVNGTCPEDLVGEDVVNGTSSDGGTVTND
jgi:hypothetical protein